MTDGDLPEQFVTQRTADANCYHTGACLSLARADKEPTPISDAAIEWHGLEECKYCDDEVAVENQRGGVADD